MAMSFEDIKKAKTAERNKKTEEKLKQKQLDKQRARIHNEMISYQKKHSKEKKTAPKGAYISLKNINKIYPNHVQAVYDFNLNISEHEFIVLVGPSGCGKSTTLRMIAGLEDITAGDLFIDGTYANELHPKDREIAMVFQSYALYPHMSVGDNISFSLKIRRFPTLVTDKDGKPILGINKKAIKNLQITVKNLTEFRDENKDTLTSTQLEEIEKDIKATNEKIEYLKVTPVECYKLKHMPKEEIKKRVENAANILQISEYLDRKPKALSGGQCQRVALGRAIVRNAKVFLMDEPLSNLDAKLRVTMRSEIIKLHETLNATTIYVTHDQTEAMTMATRIVVMNRGYVQQIDTPINIYNHPANMFVATFIGSPSMNLVKAKLNGDVLKFEKGFELKLNKDYAKTIKDFYLNAAPNCEKRLEELDSTFVERNEVLNKIEEAKKLGNEELVSKLQSELLIVEKANKDRVELLDKIEKYKSIDLKNEIDVIFGIRPEDIIKVNSNSEDGDFSKPMDFTISVSELLGHEYYAHGDFQGKEIVAKIQSKKLISAGDKMKVVFDMERIHIFDTISEDTII